MWGVNAGRSSGASRRIPAAAAATTGGVFNQRVLLRWWWRRKQTSRGVRAGCAAMAGYGYAAAVHGRLGVRVVLLSGVGARGFGAGRGGRGGSGVHRFGHCSAPPVCVVK